jgi:uncharacterized membrane protein
VETVAVIVVVIAVGIVFLVGLVVEEIILSFLVNVASLIMENVLIQGVYECYRGASHVVVRRVVVE